MAHHHRSRFFRLAALVMIAALRLCGCGPAPSQPPILPASDTTMLVTQGSRFTYLEEDYEWGKPEPIERSTTTWIASRGVPDSADSTIWRTTIVDDAQRGTINGGVMTFFYRKNGDVIMQYYYNYMDISSGYVDMVIPLSTRADVELPYAHSTKEFRQSGSHEYTYSSFTRATTCRYLGRDTIDVAGERMACEHGQVVIRVYGAPGSDNYPLPNPNTVPTDTYTVEYWFAPKIGFIAKERVDGSGVRTTAQGGRWTVRTLQSYDLK